ncbi:MAG: hypothetical protein AAB478_00595 [Patescibacteria group bacterium]
MQHLLALAIDNQKIAVPEGIPTGGLPIFIIIAERAVQVALFFIFVLALIFIIISGIKWITAGGDKTKVQSARGTLTYAIVGLVLALLSFLIIGFVGQLITGGSLNFPMLVNPPDCSSPNTSPC